MLAFMLACGEGVLLVVSGISDVWLLIEDVSDISLILVSDFFGVMSRISLRCRKVASIVCCNLWLVLQIIGFSCGAGGGSGGDWGVWTVVGTSSMFSLVDIGLV